MIITDFYPCFPSSEVCFQYPQNNNQDKIYLKQQMNFLTLRTTQHQENSSVYVTKRNSTRPNSFRQHVASSQHSSVKHDIGYSKNAIVNDSQLQRKEKDKDYVMILGEKIQIDYLNKESVLSVIQNIEKSQKIKQKTKICLELILLKQGIEKNKKLSLLFEACLKRYQNYLFDEIN